MRELSEQEIEYRNKKLNEFCPNGIDMVIGFDNGFIAGIEYQQAEVERLQIVISRLQDAINNLGYHINYECSLCGTRYDVTYSSWPNCPACKENPNNQRGEVERLQAQNAKMLEALKGMVDWVEYWGFNNDNGIEGMPIDLTAARMAIASTTLPPTQENA